MSKAMYYSLVEEYQEWIDGIKADQAQSQRLLEEYKVARQTWNIDALADAAEALDFLDREIAESLATLTARIREEYGSCPFQATRQAGIAGFWREAGLSPLG